MLSKKYKGTIIFDIDGVIFSFYKPFIDFYNQKYNKNYKVSDLVIYDISKGLNIPHQIIDDFHDEDICGNLPLLGSEIPEFIKRLKEDGYFIVLNTFFPTKYIQKRLDNLKLHNIVYDKIHFECKDKIFDLYDDIVCIFEDSPTWIKLYYEKGLKLYVPYRDYLREEPFLLKTDIERYNSFDEINIEN